MKLGNKRKAKFGIEPIKRKKAKTVNVENNGKVVEPKYDQDLISQKFKSMIKILAKVSKVKIDRHEEKDILDKSSESSGSKGLESTVDENVIVKDGKIVDDEIADSDTVLGSVFQINERGLIDNDLKSDLQKMEKIVKEALKEKDKALKKEKLKNKNLEISLKELETVKRDLKRTIDVLGLVQKKNEELEESIESKNKLIEKFILEKKEIGSSRVDKVESVEPNNVHERSNQLNSSKKKARFKLLLEARNKFFPNIRIEQMIDENLHQLLKSADGSIFFQEKCHLATDYEKDILFKIVHYNPASMANNKFGHFVFVDFMRIFSEQQKNELFKKMAPSFKPVLLNCYGSRVLQETFGFLSQEMRNLAISTLSKDIIDYSTNIFASFVLQKVIELGNVEESLQLKLIMLKIREEARFLSRDKFGSRVVQKVLVFAPEEIKTSLKSLILETLPDLIDHKYGNYIVQKLIEFGTEMEREKVVSCCSKNVLEMATSKYASNVIQWILKAGSVDDKIQVVKKLSGKKELEILVTNQYGNYVVQHIIENAEVCFLREIHDKILTVVDIDNDHSIRKLRMMVEDKFSKKNIVRLAKRFDKDDEISSRLMVKFKSFQRDIERWMGDILSFENMKVENLMLPLFIEVLEEINDQEENEDLADLRQSLKDYIKDLVAYRAKHDFGFFSGSDNSKHESKQTDNSAVHHGYNDSLEYSPQGEETMNQLSRHSQPNHYMPLPNQNYAPQHGGFAPQHLTQQQVYLAQPYPGSITYQNVPHNGQVANTQSSYGNYVNMATLPSNMQHIPTHATNTFFIPQRSQTPVQQQHVVNQYHGHVPGNFQQRHGPSYQARNY